LKNQQVISGVAARYARSLFELAQEAGITETVAGELGAVSKALDDVPEFRTFTASPIISAQQQIAALQALLPKLGAKNLTSNFVQLLAQNRRLNLLNETIIAYGQLLDKSKGLMKAEVTSAEPLSGAQAQALKDALKSTTGKDVAIDAHIDQSLIGGLIVRLGSRMVDTSLKTKLANLKVALKGTA
jgi:F-type H+-transporting ATPase subunit delta